MLMGHSQYKTPLAWACFEVEEYFLMAPKLLHAPNNLITMLIVIVSISFELNNKHIEVLIWVME